MCGEVLAGECGRVDLHRHQVCSGGVQCPADRPAPLRVARVGGQQEPVPVELERRPIGVPAGLLPGLAVGAAAGLVVGLVVGERTPGDAVAPGVQGRRFASRTPPAGQGGQNLGECGGAETEGVGQTVQVLLLDRFPERAVHRVGTPRGLVAFGGAGPEGPVLEGVRGEFDVVRPGFAEHGRPVDVHSGHVGLGEGGGEASRAAVVAAQRAAHEDPSGGDVEGVERFLHGNGQDRVRADLHEGPVAGRCQFADRRGQHDGPAQVAEPVVGVDRARLVRADPFPGERRQHGHGGLPWRRRAQCGEQLFADPVDVRGVRGVVHRDAPRPGSPVGAGAKEQVQGLCVARDDDRRGAVDRRDREAAVVSGDQLTDLRGVEHERDHPALRRRCLFGRSGGRSARNCRSCGVGTGSGGVRPVGSERDQCLAPQADHSGGVAQRECSGDAGRRDLALGVADHCMGADPGGLPELRQRDHHREQCGLHHVHPVETGRGRVAAQYAGQ